MTTDPPRGPCPDEPTPDALRAFVRARQSGPSKDTLEQISKQLSHAGAFGSEPSSSAPRAIADSVFPYLKIGLLALAIGGGLLCVWRLTQTPAAATNVHTTSITPPTSEVIGPAPRISAAPVIEAAPMTEPDLPPAPAVLSVDQLPSVAPPARAAAAPSLAANEGPRASELELVKRAQAAIGSEPKQALALTAEHARAYPTGVFAQEREVIAVEALSRLGRNDEASSRALALVKRFPQTPYAARLERALGRPLPDAPTSSSTND